MEQLESAAAGRTIGPDEGHDRCRCQRRFHGLCRRGTQRSGHSSLLLRQRGTSSHPLPRACPGLSL